MGLCGVFTILGLWGFLPWLLVGLCVVVAVVAGRDYALVQEQLELIGRRQSQVDLLTVQLDAHENAADALADGLDVALFICDGRATVQYANRQAVEMFRATEAVGKSILAITLSPDLEKLALDSIQGGRPVRAEFAFKFPEDRMGTAKAWPHPDGRRVFLSIYETTALRRLERIRQDFVANVSHELRTPLTIIRAMSETLLDSPELFAEKGEEYLGRTIAEVDRLSLISNDLLILSAAESNIVRKHACNVARVFRSVVQALEQKAADKELDLAYIGPDSAMIEANETQLTQVAFNLVENALNYTSVGGVTVEVRPDSREVKVSVRDTGIGIALDQLPRIFERFYRVDRARSRNTGGTGLGLSIVKHIVEAHGGSVNVESSLNTGSTFTIVLPVGDISRPA